MTHHSPTAPASQSESDRAKTIRWNWAWWCPGLAVLAAVLQNLGVLGANVAGAAQGVLDETALALYILATLILLVTILGVRRS